MSQHQKHLSSYLKSKRSGAATSGLSKDRNNVVGARSSTKLPGKAPAFTRTKASDLSRLPDELLLKIFRYLSPSELLVCAQVCRQWTTITKESSLWKPLLPKLPKQVRDSLTFEETKEEGFDWKSDIIKRCINSRNKEILSLKKRKKRSPYTGLHEVPQSVKPYVLGDVRWKLCITDTSNKEYWLTADSSKLFASSFCVRWYSIQLPPLTRLKTLQAFAFLPVFYHRNWTPHVNSTCTRSLILQQDLRSKDVALSKDKAVSASDLITAHVMCPSVLAACWTASWKDGGELAFITLSLHLHNLTERILFGSHDRAFVCPPHRPVPDDIDPRYGLHGYSATIELRNHVTTLWGRQYRELYQQYVTDTYVCFGGRGSEHGSFEKQISLPWKTELFKNVLPDMCFLDVTVLHEDKVPFWCFSSPVRIFSNKANDGDFSSEGKKLFTECSDEHGTIRLDFLSIEEEGQTLVTNVELRLLKAFVNSWFNTSY